MQEDDKGKQGIRNRSLKESYKYHIINNFNACTKPNPHRLSLTDPPVLVRFPYAFVLRILLSFDFPYYTCWGTSIIKDSHFYTRYGIKVGAQHLFIPQRVYFYISCLIVSTTLLISSSVNVGPEGRQRPISNKCSLVPFP